MRSPADDAEALELAERWRRLRTDRRFAQTFHDDPAKKNAQEIVCGNDYD